MSRDDAPAIFEYPDNAAFGRVLPKSKIFAFGKPTRRIRNLITSEIAQIVWSYKLAPETLNIPAKPSVPEIQIFTVTLKPTAADDLNDDALRTIDRAIGFPIIFELHRSTSAGDRVRTIAAYKRPSESDSAKWVVSDYFGTDWMPADTPRSPLPVSLDLAGLYERMLRRLLPLYARPGESIQTHVDRQVQVGIKQRECRRLEAQLQREKQFNRKVEINARLRAIRTELEELTK